MVKSTWQKDVASTLISTLEQGDALFMLGDEITEAKNRNELLSHVTDMKSENLRVLELRG